MKLVLASQSSRRQELLKNEGYSFEVCASNVEEVFDESIDLDLAIQKVAYDKAKDVHDLYPECVVLGADTIVVYQDKRLGKPKDIDQARQFLKMLSGQSHYVKTGVAIVYPDHVKQFTETTEVHFRNLSDLEIEKYLKKQTCLDKAGAYGIQECDFADWIDGSFNNVVGLPTEMLKKVLAQ